MKKIIISAVVLVLVGAGCVQSGNNPTRSVNDAIDESINWSSVNAFGYSFSLPVNQLTTLSTEDRDYLGEEYQYMGKEYTGIIYRQNEKLGISSAANPDLCTKDFYTAKVTLEGYTESEFNYRRTDESTGHLLTKEDAYDYVKLKRGEVLSERELENGAWLVIGSGRYASAPCIGSQYSGFIVDGSRVVWVRLYLDEPRQDIVSTLFESIRPVE